MEKPLLDSLGAQQVLASLYGLPEKELQQESQNALENLAEWLENHFDLKPGQVLYLEQIPEDYFTFLSEKIAHFLSLRLPIQLVTPYAADDDLPPIDHPGKLLITGLRMCPIRVTPSRRASRLPSRHRPKKPDIVPGPVAGPGL